MFIVLDNRGMNTSVSDVISEFLIMDRKSFGNKIRELVSASICCDCSYINGLHGRLKFPAIL